MIGKCLLHIASVSPAATFCCAAPPQVKNLEVVWAGMGPLVAQPQVLQRAGGPAELGMLGSCWLEQAQACLTRCC